MITATAAMHCLDFTSFNLAGTANAYSVLSGVLAGIAFLSITYVLTDRAQIGQHSDHGKNEVDHILIALFCATFGLVIATLQYAILSGELGSGLLYGRAASEELFADISFIAAILTLVYGLSLLLAASEFHRAASAVRLIAAVGAPALSVFFLAGSVVEVAAGAWAQRGNGKACGVDGFFRAASTYGTGLAPVLVLVTSGLLYAWPKAVPRKWRATPWAFVARHRALLSASALLVVFASAYMGTSFDQYQPNSGLSAGSAWIVLSAAIFFFLFQASLIRFSSGRPDETDPIPVAKPVSVLPGPVQHEQHERAVCTVCGEAAAAQAIAARALAMLLEEVHVQPDGRRPNIAGKPRYLRAVAIPQAQGRLARPPRSRDDAPSRSTSTGTR